ncbi:MAG: hypothetical protein FWE21_10520 [Defluviitaleaceae bacterium]|nr:hypothetical protein [Defluviitaleaceae bacterium]
MFRIGIGMTVCVIWCAMTLATRRQALQLRKEVKPMWICELLSLAFLGIMAFVALDDYKI